MIVRVTRLLSQWFPVYRFAQQEMMQTNHHTKEIHKTLFQDASVIPISIGFSVNKGVHIWLSTSNCWYQVSSVSNILNSDGDWVTTVHCRFQSAAQTVWKGFHLSWQIPQLLNHLSTNACHRKANAPTLFVRWRTGVSVPIWKVFWNAGSNGNSSEWLQARKLPRSGETIRVPNQSSLLSVASMCTTCLPHAWKIHEWRLNPVSSHSDMVPLHHPTPIWWSL